MVSIDFTRLRAVREYNKHAEAANLIPIPNDEVAQFKQRCIQLELEFGAAMRREYGWASPVFSDRSKVSFRDIEEYSELDHWRPRYKWASQHTHAGHRDPGVLLGLSEATEDIILVGPSDSGFVDPIQMTAMHISGLTAILLLSRPNVSGIIATKVLDKFSAKVAGLAIELNAKIVND